MNRNRKVLAYVFIVVLLLIVGSCSTVTTPTPTETPRFRFSTLSPAEKTAQAGDMATRMASITPYWLWTPTPIALKLGRWQGGNLTFTVTEKGIIDILLSVPCFPAQNNPEGYMDSSYLIVPVKKNGFEFNFYTDVYRLDGSKYEVPSDTIEGSFSSLSTASGTYNCHNFQKYYSGKWEASWQGTVKKNKYRDSIYVMGK